MRWIPRPDPLLERGPIATQATVVLVAMVAMHVVLAWAMRLPDISWGEDDAAYIQLAQQLRHLSYREVHDVTAPIHARFPPGYPLLIAVLGWVFGDRPDGLVVINTVLSVVTTLLIFLTTRRHLGEPIALLVSALFALNPSTLFDSGHVMAEAAFKFWMVLGLWALTREGEGRRFSLLAGGAMLAAALTRSAGIFLLPALFGYWVLQRQYTRAGLLIVASLLTVGIWLGWTVLAPDPENRRLYVADFGIASARPRPRLAFLGDIVARFPARIRRLSIETIPTSLALPVIAGTRVDNALWLGALVVLGGTGLVVMLRRWTSAALITLSYLALLLIWRYALMRFVNPIVPFLLAALFVGTDSWVGRFAPRQRAVARAVLFALLALGAVRAGVSSWERTADCDRSAPVTSEGCWDAAYRVYLRAAMWVRDSTPPDAVFFVNKERGFYYHTARRTINQDRTLQEDSLSLAGYLRSRGAHYAVAAPVGLQAPEHYWLLADACRDFVVLRTFTERTVVLRLRAPSEGPDPRACNALAPFRGRRPLPD
jgi:Dolichyl-phosphate-mannose-protein mannosyltransferase